MNYNIFISHLMSFSFCLGPTHARTHTHTYTHSLKIATRSTRNRVIERSKRAVVVLRNEDVLEYFAARAAVVVDAKLASEPQKSVEQHENRDVVAVLDFHDTIAAVDAVQTSNGQFFVQENGANECGIRYDSSGAAAAVTAVDCVQTSNGQFSVLEFHGGKC